MSAIVQPKALKAMLDAMIGSDHLRVVLLDSTYTYDAAHDFLNDVGSGSRLGASGNMTGVTTTDGILLADDPTVSGVGSGHTVTQAWFYVHTGTESTSRLLVYTSENADTTPLNYETDGADINVILPGGEVGRL